MENSFLNEEEFDENDNERMIEDADQLKELMDQYEEEEDKKEKERALKNFEADKPIDIGFLKKQYENLSDEIEKTGKVYNTSGKNFRLQSKGIHLVYKTWINKESIKEWYEEKLGLNIEFFLAAHEEGDANNNKIKLRKDFTPYKHTHVFIILEEAPNIKNARFFDIWYEDDVENKVIEEIYGLDDEEERNLLGESFWDKNNNFYGKNNPIHPYIQGNITSKTSKANMIAYLSKEDKENAKYKRSWEEKLAQLKDINSGLKLEDVRKQKDFVDVLALRELPLKSVMDLHIAFNAKKTYKDEGLYKKEDFTIELPKEFRCLFICGPSQIGKTQLALCQFEHPLQVSHMDDLKNFKPEFHDGIVFDDMDFHLKDRSSCIHLVDWDCNRSINVKGTVATIPKNTRKIFTSNESFEKYWPHDPHEAIRKRFTHVIILDKTLLFKSVKE